MSRASAPIVLPAVLAAIGIAAVGCGTDEGPIDPTGTGGTPIGLTAPEFCAKCHPQHYDEWRTSMHAYGTLDPVFVAMNALAMNQSKGKVGQFCVTCHAPSAAFRKQTPIGIDGDGNYTMPFDLENPVVRNGVQCITCHSVKSVTATSNGQLVLADDVLFGPTASERAQQAHPIEKSPTLTSSTLCGGCHDVINPAGTLVENTFSEWYNSHYNDPDPKLRTRCQDCHMPTYEGRITDDSDVRTLHRHTFVGVDQALIKGFPGKAQQAELVRQLLRGAATMTIERRPDTAQHAVFRVTITNDNTGHNLPSGATADRQMWVELQVASASEVKYKSGFTDENGDLMDGIEKHSTDPSGDPDLMLFNQIFYGGPNCPPTGKPAPPGACNPVTFPWQARRSEDYLIPVGASRYRDYEVPLSELTAGKVTVTARLLFRTFPPHLIRALQAAGVLKANALEPIPIVEMARLEERY